MKKIIITGGSGNFASYFKKFSKKYKIFFPNSSKLNILDTHNLRLYLNKIKPDYVIHNAAVSRPMSQHKKNIFKSINVNIIGTSNVVLECAKKNIKLIYFSSSYVYGGKSKGNYKETDPILPCNNYAWTKLGGEAAVQIYKNSLILRLSVTQYPFQYTKAFKNVYSNFIYHDEAANLIMKLLNKKGIINIGGKKKSIFNFAKQSNPRVKPVYLKKKSLTPFDSSLNIKKLQKELLQKK